VAVVVFDELAISEVNELLCVVNVVVDVGGFLVELEVWPEVPVETVVKTLVFGVVTLLEVKAMVVSSVSSVVCVVVSV
jgi:hypothetical protein